MKYLAHVAPSLTSDIICIHDVAKDIKSNPKESESKRYYSLWYLTPMTARIGKQNKPHFAFIKGSNPAPSEIEGGESIEHDMTKHEIFKTKSLYLKHNYDRKEDIIGLITFSEIKIEYRFDNGKYIADLYAKIESDEKNILKLNKHWIVIEIFKSNKSSKFKEAYYRKKNIAAIEIKLWDKIQFKDNTELLKKQISGWLKKPNYFHWINDPNYKMRYNNSITLQKENIIDSIPIDSSMQSTNDNLSKDSVIQDENETHTTLIALDNNPIGKETLEKTSKSIQHILMEALKRIINSF